RGRIRPTAGAPAWSSRRAGRRSAPGSSASRATSGASSSASSPRRSASSCVPRCARSWPAWRRRPKPEKRMNMKRGILWVGIILALSGIGYAGFRIIGGRKDTGPKFTTVPVDRGAIVAKVTASGTLSAVTTVQVGSQVSGRIVEIKTDFNGTVKKGDVIARIDPELFKASVEQAKANLLADQAALEKAKVQAADSERQYNRNKTLLQHHLVAQADADTAQANYH